MRSKICIFLIIILFVGCTHKTCEYDDIDFIAYSWRIKYKEKEWKFYCTTYALIDKNGNCDVITERFYPKSEVRYYKVKIRKSEIDSIIERSKNITNDYDLRPKKGTSFYDGPSLKIKINKNKNSRTIHFFDESIIDRNFVGLYRTIAQSIEDGNSEEITESVYLKQRKLDFINYCMRSDSILRPPPPPPSEEAIKKKK